MPLFRIVKIDRILARVRGKSAPELARLAARRAGRVAAGLLNEARARAGGPRVGDAELAEAVGESSAAGAVSRLRATLGSPLVGPADRAPLIAVLERHPATREALSAAAAAALAGTVDLLGSGPRQLGPTPDWHRDFVSGGSWDPGTFHMRLHAVRYDGSDVKIPWELSRLQHLPLLASVDLVAPDAAIPAFVATQVDDWIAKNPPGFGVNWACTMDVAMRATSLAWAYALLHERLAAAFHRAFLGSMLEHGRFIAANLEDGGPFVGNHFLADVSGLAFLAQTFPAFREAARWSEVARDALEREIRRQILPDGADFEASTSYHRLVFELLLLPALLGRRNARDFSSGYWERLRAMAVYDATLQNAAGFVPQFGDNDSGRGFRLVPRPDLDHGYLNALAAAALGDPGLCAGRSPDAEAAFLAGPEAFERIEVGGGARPRSSAFPDGGAFVLRRGEVELFIRCGDKGQGGLGGHAHNDALSFELSVAGQRLVVDPGTGSYTGDPALRNRLRGTRAHSTVVVDGREQCPMAEDDLFALPDRLRLVERVLDVSAGTFTGEIATATHRHLRRFALTEDELRVADEVAPAAALELNLTLRPGLAAELRDSTVQLGGVQLGASGGSVELVDGAYSRAYGLVETARVIRIRGRGRSLELTFRFGA
ncbi:MAG TPA: alginate lyase family protein [Myxococcales bacterium]|nr:alginate lyase family protein [Myxococcales bacterium]